MNTIDQTTCQIHQQPIIAIDKTQKDNYQKGMCAICLSLLNDKVILLQDANNQIVSLKQQTIENQKQIVNQNIETLQLLSQQIFETKNQLIIAFDKLLVNLEQWTNQLKGTSDKIQKEIESIDTISGEQLIQELEKLITNKNQNNYHYKGVVVDTIKQITQSLNFEKIPDIVDQIIFKTQDLQCSDQVKSIGGVYEHKNAKPILKCEEHLEEILFLDISSKEEDVNRLGCVDCQDNYIERKYTSIKRVKERWEQYQGDKNIQLNDFKEQSNNIINQLQVCFEQLKNFYHKKVSETVNFFNEMQNNIFTAVECESCTFATDWSTLTKEELAHIAIILSKQENYRTQDLINKAQIQLFVNEQLYNLQEAQSNCAQQIFEHFQQNLQFYSENQDKIITQEPIFQNTMTCPTHKRQMVFDLNELASNKQRIICPQCSTQDITHSIDRQGFVKLWKQHQIQNTITLNHIQQGSSIKIDSMVKAIKQEFEGILNHFRSIIWQQANQTLYGDKVEVKQSLTDEEVVNAHFKVYCVIMNKNEDLMISSGLDTNIKFWTKNKQWDCFQTLTCHIGMIRDIALNDSDNGLISTGEDSQIVISQIGGDRKWSVIQKIQAQILGFRPFNGKKMEVFEKKQNQQFYKVNEVKVASSVACEWCIPQTFNKQKKILLNKNGVAVHIMRQKKGTDFVVDQKIYFSTQNAYGAMTDDAEYLVTWDTSSKQFQVRKYQK